MADAGKTAGSISAIIAVPTAFFGLLFLLLPNWVPWTSSHADVQETIMEHNANVEQILPRWYRDVPPEGTTLEETTTPEGWPTIGTSIEVFENETIPFEPQTVGNVVSYKIELEGYKGILSKAVSVYWSVYDAETGQRSSDPQLINQRGWPTSSIIAKRRLVVASGDAFVPIPHTDGTYFIRLEAWDEENARLDVEDTEEFEVVNGRSREVTSNSKNKG